MCYTHATVEALVGNTPNPSLSLEQSSLRLVFWDLFSDPEDVRTWSGTPSSIIKGLREAGQQVTVAGFPLPTLRRAFSSTLWHFYTRARHLHYIPDRDARIVRPFIAFDEPRSKRAFAEAEAILTTSTTGPGFLKTDKPIFLVHDATWGQVLELYTYFAAESQVPSVVRDGFDMERATFCRPNVTLIMSSQWAADRAIRDYNLDPAHVFVQPLGSNFAVDPPREEVEVAVRSRGGDLCRLLFVGREFERKGGPIAVAVATKLREWGIPTVLQIVGCHPEGLPNWVEIYGPLYKGRPEDAARLQSLYANADFFLLPTRAEAQGIVFNEAAAYGLPVAATDVGGVATVVNPAWACLLPLDAPAESYAEWISAAFADRKCYFELALRARDDFERRLSRAAYTARLLEIIRSTLAIKAT